jgi:hypothetical protein
MRIDSIGNVGIGVAPESWYTPLSTRALQLGGTTSLWALSNGSTDLRTTLDNNLYVSNGGVNAYLNTGPASRYQQQNGTHRFFTVSSGTADATATTTERMRIDSAGRVTTPNQPSFLAALTSNFHTGSNVAKVTGWSVSGNQRYSIGGNFSSNRFTAPVDGRYLFNYTGLHHAGVSGTSSWIRIHYYVNGTSYLDALGDHGTYGLYQRLSVSTIFNLSANDYVEIYASDQNGDSDNGFVYSSYTYFSGHLLG